MRKTKLKIIHPEITKERLRKAASEYHNARIGLRIAIVQEMLDNEPLKKIGERHKFSRSQIYKIAKRINELGLRGLSDEPHLGRPKRLTVEQEKEIKDAITKPPSESGYSQSRWDGPLLMRYIEERYGIRYKIRQSQYLFHRLGLSLQRGRRNPSKADPEKQNEFKDELKKLETNPLDEAYVFLDEAGVYLDPTIIAQWALVNHQPQYPTDLRRRRVNLFGWVSPIDGRNGVIRIERGNTENFLRSLPILLDAFSDKRVITVILDNARWHKNNAVDDFLRKHPFLKFWYLPTYSPNLNFQERLWRFLRQKATHCHRFDDETDCWNAILVHYLGLTTETVMKLCSHI